MSDQIEVSAAYGAPATLHFGFTGKVKDFHRFLDVWGIEDGIYQARSIMIESKNGWFFFRINGPIYLFLLEIGRFGISWEKK